MGGMKKFGFYTKRFCGAAAVAAIFAAAVYNVSADDVRLLRQIDNNYDGISIESDGAYDTVININTASVHHLQRIDGIGETRALAIVEYREAHGGFESVEELVNVSGIGEKTLDAIRGKITV